MEKGVVKKTQKQISVTIKAVKKILHMKLNLLIHQTAKKILETMTVKEEKMLLYKTKRYFQRKVLLKVPQRNILVTMQVQMTLKY